MPVERRIYMRTIKRSFIALTLIFLLILIGFAWIVNDVNNIARESKKISKQSNLLVKENKKRITEIQDSRVASCKRTYDAIEDVFSPFFPKPPRLQEQEENIRKFRHLIDQYRKGCIEQTKPDEG